MPSTEPEVGSQGPTRRRAETQRRLIDAAYEVYAEVGIRDAPIELICQRAGFTRGAFYSNFGSKEELFLAMYELQMAARSERLLHASVDALDMVGRGEPDRLERVVLLIAKRFLAGLDDDLRWYPVNAEFRAQALRRPELQERTAMALSRFEATIIELLRGLARDLDLRFVLPVELTSAMVRLTYEMQLERSLLGVARNDSAETRAQTLAAMVLSLFERTSTE